MKQPTTHVEAFVELFRDAGSIPAASTRLVDKAFIDNALRLSGTRARTRVPVFGVNDVCYSPVTLSKQLAAMVSASKGCR